MSKERSKRSDLSACIDYYDMLSDTGRIIVMSDHCPVHGTKLDAQDCHTCDNEREALDNNVDGKEFYELMQQYRNASHLDQDRVTRMFLDVKIWIKNNY
jgi:hypothetical protein